MKNHILKLSILVAGIVLAQNLDAAKKRVVETPIGITEVATTPAAIIENPQETVIDPNATVEIGGKEVSVGKLLNEVNKDAIETARKETEEEAKAPKGALKRAWEKVYGWGISARDYLMGHKKEAAGGVTIAGLLGTIYYLFGAKKKTERENKELQKELEKYKPQPLIGQEVGGITKTKGLRKKAKKLEEEEEE